MYKVIRDFFSVLLSFADMTNSIKNYKLKALIQLIKFDPFKWQIGTSRDLWFITVFLSVRYILTDLYYLLAVQYHCLYFYLNSNLFQVIKGHLRMILIVILIFRSTHDLQLGQSKKVIFEYFRINRLSNSCLKRIEYFPFNGREPPAPRASLALDQECRHWLYQHWIDV